MSAPQPASGRLFHRFASTAVLALTLGSAWLTPSPTWAHEHHPHAAPAAVDSRSSFKMEKLRLPEVQVVDQDGLKLSFRRDLVKDRVVVVSFIYTTCTAICSPLTANLQRARDLLDPALAERASFISISIDPQTDSPAALKAFAEQYGIAGNWHFITGKAAHLHAIQKAFAVAMKRKEDHTPLIIIGNSTTHQWARKYGLAPPEAIAEAIISAAGGE